jgi:hypothetical protein
VIRSKSDECGADGIKLVNHATPDDLPQQNIGYSIHFTLFFICDLAHPLYLTVRFDI